MISFPKDTPRLSWTRHIKNKMVFYHLSGAQILRILQRPDRREEGIAEGTVAAMKVKKAVGAKSQEKRAKREEIWIMYKNNSKLRTDNLKPDLKNSSSSVIRHKSLVKPRVVMISAWRYPGETKPGERPEIPEDALEELTNN